MAAHAPQVPPQPSSPHALPEQAGVQEPPAHCPELVHEPPASQVPQLPPQPSSPQALPAQLGVHEEPWLEEELPQAETHRQRAARTE